jgi:competence protein ComEA
MITSLFIKLGMFALTMGIVLWIGWAVPQEQHAGREGMLQNQDTNPARTRVFAITAATTTPAPPAQPKPSPRSPAIEKLDLNRATEQDFESLPGIGPVLAGRIVEYRQGVGSFRSVEGLRDVKGIGKKKFDRIRNLIHVVAPIVPSRDGKKTT